MVLPDFSPTDSPTDELFTLEHVDWTEPGQGMVRSFQLQFVDEHKQNRVRSMIVQDNFGHPSYYFLLDVVLY